MDAHTLKENFMSQFNALRLRASIWKAVRAELIDTDLDVMPDAVGQIAMAFDNVMTELHEICAEPSSDGRFVLLESSFLGQSVVPISSDVTGVRQSRIL